MHELERMVWIDESFYPGPEDWSSNPNPWEGLTAVFADIGNALHQTIENVWDSYKYAFRVLIDDLAKDKPQPLPIHDRDKPEWFNRNTHGPYEGSRFTHAGRKLY